jgi:DNA-binding NarL/FixJ family response regulator
MTTRNLRRIVHDFAGRIEPVAAKLLEGENGWEVCGEAADGDEAGSRTLHPDVVVIEAMMSS